MLFRRVLRKQGGEAGSNKGRRRHVGWMNFRRHRSLSVKGKFASCGVLAFWSPTVRSERT